MTYTPSSAILYPKIHVSQYIIPYFILIYGCLVWSYSFSGFDSHTAPQYSELKLLKVNDIFSLSKLLFIFNFTEENIPEDLKRYLALINLYICMKLAPPRFFIFQKGKLDNLAGTL